MANEIVKIDRGLSTNLPSTKDPGRILITTDTNQMYVDDTAENRIHIQDDTKIPLTGSSAISGNLVPSATNANDLGSSTNEWNNIYGNIIHGNVVHAPTLATNEIEPDTNTKLVISGGTSNEVDIQSNVGIGGNLTIGSSTNTVVITPTTLTLNATAKTAWQTELGITEGGLTQEQADDRYLQLTGGAITGRTTISVTPKGNNDVVNKLYVDTMTENALEVIQSTYLPLTGTALSATQLATSRNFSITGGATASAVAFNGTQNVTLNITSLDATKLSGTIPTANLPSYVDDVVEYANKSAFPGTGESGKIYVALDTNLTYRWGGSEYVEISPSLALGTKADTAFRGDYGQTAYNHANAKGNQYASGFYKIATNNQGHVTGATAVTADDIGGLVDSRYDTRYIPRTLNDGVSVDLNGRTLDFTTGVIQMSQLDIGLDGVNFLMDENNSITFNPVAQNAFRFALGLSDALTQTTADTRYLQLTGGTLSGTLNFGDSISIDGTDGLTLNEDMVSQWQSVLAVPTNALTQSSADTRYLRLSGGTVSGSTTFTNGIRIGSSTGPTITSQGSSLVISSNIDMNGNTIENVTIDGYLTESVADSNYLQLAGGTVTGVLRTTRALSAQSGLYIRNTSGTTTYVTMTASGGLTLNPTALANWQEELEITRFVISSTQPSDTNVIWLKPVS